ncbi:DUF4862 family protein [Thiotrichales bacterium 19S3-7]|nr:DUF4862 family protein [Thiotrichales bacterium 19S3-7]MCF6801716.1 DUF4862 family protein [Thiotrichales bacterium 19S3-11]
MHKFYFSSYSMTPALDKFDEAFESCYISKLSQYPEIIGIEYPYLLDHSIYSNEFLKANIPDHWQVILTALPVTMQSLSMDPEFGLASTNAKSRRNSVRMIKQINHRAIQLNDLFQRQVVKGIHIQTAPSSYQHIKGTKEALMQSLAEICNWQWQSVELNIEHCDAKAADRLPEKGFLSLADEICAIREVEHVGIMLNWARSVIEGHSRDRAIKHIQQAQDSGYLRGYFFSGCSDSPSSVYGAFKDSHMPPRLAEIDESKDSLLDEHTIETIYNQLNADSYLGIKIAPAVKKFDLKSLLSLTKNTLSCFN